MSDIQMVDLKSQYQALKPQINQVIDQILNDSQYIGGQHVKDFEQNLASFLNTKHVVACANGTDALQIALMCIGAKRGDEVIIPAFTYVATAEVIALLGLKPVMVDIDPLTFNIQTTQLRSYITEKTIAIIPVHLFGQSADMETIMDIANEFDLKVIEDNAQSLGAKFSPVIDGTESFTGNIGHIGTTSFYPSKVLGAYGDGGAMSTTDPEVAARLRMIANHGQSKRYYHDIVGCNSRLDSIQAAILDIKLKYLNSYILRRQKVAESYDKYFQGIEEISTPYKSENSTHIYHQYTIRVNNGKRNQLVDHLQSLGIPSMVYYPVPLYKQKAYQHYYDDNFKLKNTELACEEVLSLPICPELNLENQNYIIEGVKSFFRL